MMSSVAERCRLYSRRISCCFASSRENTTIFLGCPISPRSSLRTRACPSEPVPPVTSTRFSSSGPMSFPPSVVGRIILRQSGYHGVPRRHGDASGSQEPRPVQAAIHPRFIRRLNRQIQSRGVLDLREEVVLAYGLARHVVQPL